MAQSLVRGQKVVLSETNDALLTKLHIEMQYDDLSKVDFDFFAYILEENNIIRKKNIIFYNHPMDELSSVYLNEHYAKKVVKTFNIDLKKASPLLNKIVFGVHIYKEEADNSHRKSLSIICKQKQLNLEIFNINYTIDVKDEKSFIIGDIYPYKEQWKFNAVLFNSDKNLKESIQEFYNVKI